jgi:hypothetical protein
MGTSVAASTEALLPAAHQETDKVKSSALTPVCLAVSLASALVVSTLDGQAQSENTRRGGPRDWSHSRVVASRFGPDLDANISRNWRTVVKHAQLDRARARRTERTDMLGVLTNGVLRDRFLRRPIRQEPAHAQDPEAHLDWNLATGGYGSVIGSPAKYSFDITTASCADVIYFTVDQAGTATRVNLIAITNAYSFCPGNVADASRPTVKFAFSLPYGVPTSAVPSINGEVLYVLESRPSGNGGVILHAINVDKVGWDPVNSVWKGAGASGVYNFTNNTWSGARDLSTASMGVNGEQLFELTYAGVTNTLASPYLDYDSNQLFFGDSSGEVHRVANVDLPTAAKNTANGFPVSCGSAALQSPVYVVPATAPLNNPQIITTSADGRAYRINTFIPNSGTYTCIASSQGGAGTGIGVGGGLAAPVIDVTNEQIIIVGNYASAAALRGIGVLRLRFLAGEVQSSAQSLGLGSATLAPQPPSFDEAFWSTNVGNIYVPGAPASGAGTYLVRVPYAGGPGPSAAVGAPAGFATLFRTSTAQTVGTSPVTEFLTGSGLDTNKDFVYIGGASGNYRYMNRIGANFGIDATPVAMAASFQNVGGGGVISGIIIDQRTTSVTGSAATANIYYGTVGVPSSVQSRIVQLAQRF